MARPFLDISWKRSVRLKDRLDVGLYLVFFLLTGDRNLAHDKLLRFFEHRSLAVGDLLLVLLLAVQITHHL